MEKKKLKLLIEIKHKFSVIFVLFTLIKLNNNTSDHRPILLREASFDYGPTPFRYFHYWNEMEGFNKVVEDAWREGLCDKTNAMLNMMIKLKFLKAKIREWNISNMLSEGNEEIVNKRTEDVNNIQKLDKIHSSEMAQKAKVKWSIEGDENTSFFHGVLNKKRSILNIQGIMVDENWIESPKAVKGCGSLRRFTGTDGNVERDTLNLAAKSCGWILWKWDLESSGDFSVASVRNIIDDKSLLDVNSKTRWIKYVPIKVNVHAWKVKTDSLPTRFNVSRRGIDIDSIMCAICDNGVETSRHLFFYCCTVRQIVRKITRWWDVPYVEAESYED
ncbi:RNA-directed DNA polymerase, eukaryota [Tanacetum coccineum]